MMKVLFVATEFSPLIKVGGLADVIGSLPKALRRLGVDARVLLPGYSSVSPRKTCQGVPLYFIKSHRYFDKIYPGGALESEQFVFFSRATVDWLLTGEFAPDVIHCHDYHTALIPDILAERGIKIPTLFTIHDLANTGNADVSVLDSPNMLKRGIYTATKVSTVSPTYAREITPLVGGRELAGILNGVDYDVFDPKRDKFLKTRLSRSIPAWKRRSKRLLQAELGLPLASKTPLLAMVTRLVERKGVRLFVESLLPFLGKDDPSLQVVILGTGDPDLEALLKKTATHFANFKAIIKFSEPLAHRIFAGADFFVVPSLFEPCGLTQMIAMRYGTIPLVRKTGGLADSVSHLQTGLVFDKYQRSSLEQAISQALDLSPAKKQAIQRRAFRADFSWQASAKKYLALYRQLLSANEAREGEGRTIIFAPLRMRRPRQKRRQVVKEQCLFCPGNEKLVSPEISRRTNKFGKWSVRVIPNRYPILNVHEVIITTRKHGVDLVDFSPREMSVLFSVYRERAKFYDPERVLIYHNFGSPAGASIAHSHSQLVVIPHTVKTNFPVLEKNPTHLVKCGSRSFFCYAPRQSRWQWEVAIGYRHNTLEFSKIRDADLKELSRLFLTTLRGIFRLSGVSPSRWSYNFFITPGKRWQLRIVPRLEIPAGLELGSGIEVNPVPPEYVARELSKIYTS